MGKVFWLNSNIMEHMFGFVFDICANVSGCAAFFPTLSPNRNLILDNSAKPQIQFNPNKFQHPRRAPTMWFMPYYGYYDCYPLPAMRSLLFPCGGGRGGRREEPTGPTCPTFT